MPVYWPGNLPAVAVEQTSKGEYAKIINELKRMQRMPGPGRTKKLHKLKDRLNHMKRVGQINREQLVRANQLLLPMLNNTKWAQKESRKKDTREQSTTPFTKRGSSMEDQASSSDAEAGEEQSMKSLTGKLKDLISTKNQATDRQQ